MVIPLSAEVGQAALLEILLGSPLAEREAHDIRERLAQGESPENLLRELVDRFKGTREGRGLALILQAGHYYQQGQPEKALKACTEARKALQAWPQAKASVRSLEAPILTALRRYDDAFAAFREREQEVLKRQTQERVQGFYQEWAAAGIGQSLEGLLASNLKDFEAGGEKVITVLKAAKEAGHEDAVGAAMDKVEAGLPPEHRPLVEELRLYVRLMSIEDPFEAWEELGKSLSKKWPKGLSVAQEVRKR
jgi:tetratricopeptide (TPR) repeat protein